MCFIVSHCSHAYQQSHVLSAHVHNVAKIIMQLKGVRFMRATTPVISAGCRCSVRSIALVNNSHVHTQRVHIISKHYYGECKMPYPKIFHGKMSRPYVHDVTLRTAQPGASRELSSVVCTYTRSQLMASRRGLRQKEPVNYCEMVEIKLPKRSILHRKTL